MIESTIHATKQFDGVISAVKATDTVKQSSNNTVQATLNRDIVWLAQTPQVFDKNMLKKALSSLNEKNDLETDEAMTMEKMGYSIGIVEGSRFNIKITTPYDLKVANSYNITKFKEVEKVKDFLNHTCHKAGLPSDSWKDKTTKISKFQGVIFRELLPNGEIIREKFQ